MGNSLHYTSSIIEAVLLWDTEINDNYGRGEGSWRSQSFSLSERTSASPFRLDPPTWVSLLGPELAQGSYRAHLCVVLSPHVCLAPVSKYTF